MDHDRIESDRTRPPSRTADEAHSSGDNSHADLPGQVGNRAFAAMVQRSAERSQGAGPLDPDIADDISAARSGGRPLDDSTREDMESHLGADLTNVRVHTDTKADTLNRAVQAEAFTTGSDVFFRSGRYAPESTDGRRLLAHELTHVVQQRDGVGAGESRVSHPDDAHEREARSVGDAVAASNAPAATVDREEEDEEVMPSAIDREEEDEEVMPSAVDREEEDEEVMPSAVDREEEDEEVMPSAVDREEEDEEVMPSAIDREEEDEEVM